MVAIEQKVFNRRKKNIKDAWYTIGMDEEWISSEYEREREGAEKKQYRIQSWNRVSHIYTFNGILYHTNWQLISISTTDSRYLGANRVLLRCTFNN